MAYRTSPTKLTYDEYNSTENNENKTSIICSIEEYHMSNFSCSEVHCKLRAWRQLKKKMRLRG